MKSRPGGPECLPAEEHERLVIYRVLASAKLRLEAEGHRRFIEAAANAVRRLYGDFLLEKHVGKGTVVGRRRKKKETPARRRCHTEEVSRARADT